MKNTFAIVGIHTGIGKTISSAVIAEAIDADYWKPVQAGADERDTVLVKQLLTHGEARVHNEAVLLTQPMSPHAAAAIDNVTVDYTSFPWPLTDKPLLVETAGGILSPISASATMADFVAHYKLPTILISMNYLGSINHTLMSVEVLKSRGIPLLGIIMNGLQNEDSESFIHSYSSQHMIARIPFISTLDNEHVHRIALQLKPLLLQFFNNVHN